MYIVDLHSHSNVSDGILNPDELITYASEKKVNMLALTDHDDIAGLEIAKKNLRNWGSNLLMALRYLYHGEIEPSIWLGLILIIKIKILLRV